MQSNDFDGGNDYASANDPRRRYPKDQEGVKDEWRALIRHQTELIDIINQRERELKQMKQDELGKAYDQKRQEAIQAKEYELRLKQQEAQVVASKADQFRLDMQKQQDDRNALQKHLASQYTQDMNAKAQQEKSKKEQQLEEERRMLEDAKRRADEARRRELAKQEEYYHVFNEEIRRNEAKNNKLLEDKIRDKLSYKDAYSENERKQALKEENYKNFFRLSADHQGKYMDLHAQNVLNPQIEKQKQIDNIIDKRIVEEREKQLEEELRRKRIREDQLNGVGQANRDKMEYSDYIKKLEKADKNAHISESLKQQSDYQDFLRTNKAQKLDQQKNYKEFLDKQYAIQQENNQLNKMTKEEKRFNFGDLQAYKVYDPKQYTLIPGILTSKYDGLGAGEHKFSGAGGAQQNNYGSTATAGSYSASNNYQTPTNYQAAGSYQGANDYQSSNNYQASNNYSAPTQDYQTSAQPYDYNSKGTAGSYLQNPPAASSSPNKDRGYDTGSQFPKYDANPSSSLYSPSAAGRSAGMAGSQYSPTKAGVTSGHNPILNPLPVNMQNPYINREINKITQKQPYFANMASNNLLA